MSLPSCCFRFEYATRFMASAIVSDPFGMKLKVTESRNPVEKARERWQ